MGADCTSVRNISKGIDEKDKSNENANQSDIANFDNNEKELNSVFNFNTYKDYFKLMQQFNDKLSQAMSKYSKIINFKAPSQREKDANFFYYDYFYNVSMQRLYETAISVFQRIGNVYGNLQNYPKEEIGKISYGLISRYMAYDYGNEDEIMIAITSKVIKRTNFFSEEFPFKLKRLDTIIKSRKIYIFGYDRNLSLNFYIEPNLNERKFDLYQNNNEYKENQFEFYSDIKQQQSSKEQIITNSDFITYIFFIIEHVLPLLKERFKFSSQVNITINFNGKECDTEMISYLITSFTNYYPLGLGRINVVNYVKEKLLQNKAFFIELRQMDYFRNVVFHNESYQFHLVKYIDPNCLPITYGGYHSLLGYSLDKDVKIDDFIYYTLSMILINSNI